MFEQSKAARRRFYNGNFHNRYFNGNGIDIGGKPDPFSQYIGVFPLVKSMKIWDMEDGDAQYMKNCEEESFNFVVSSHCLEHMVDVYEALKNWIRITQKGGYLIITVPDEDMYEQEQWPSTYNEDHKWTFTIQKSSSWSKKSINILDLVKVFQDEIEVEKIEKISEFYNYNLSRIDQTLQPTVEAAIEIIMRKRTCDYKIDIQQNRVHLNIEQPVDFSVQFSRFFKMVQGLDKTKKYIVYGYGSGARVLDKILGDSIVGFVDRTSDIISQDISRDIIYSPTNISNMKFDYVLMSVFGREEEIISNLPIFVKDKIIKLI